jgi:hypothetical protein
MAQKLFQLFLSLIFLFWNIPVWATDYTQDANCQGAWLFTEGSGTTVADATGNGYTGNFKGSGEPVWGEMSGTNAPSYAPYYADFDGVDDYIRVSATGVAGFEPTQELSVCVWVMRDGGAEDYGRIFNKAWNNGATTPYYSYDIESIRTSDINYYAQVYTTGAQRQTANNLLPDTAIWVHIAFVVSRDGGDNTIIITVYKDGVSLITGDTGNAGNITYETDAGEGDLFLFAEGTGRVHCLNGKATEWAMFNRVLSSTEANDIMDNGLAGAAAARRIMLIM